MKRGLTDGFKTGANYLSNNSGELVTDVQSVLNVGRTHMWEIAGEGTVVPPPDYEEVRIATSKYSKAAGEWNTS